MIRRLFDFWWACVLGLALIAWLAGGIVMREVADNGGSALGQGIKGGFTLVSAIGSGFAQADAVDAQVKAAEAEQRLKEAEERAKKRAKN